MDARIEVGDFFCVDPTASYDAVIGNPPYVRYQDFSGEPRARSRAAALRAGVGLTNLASSWAAFTVHSALFLKPGGRVGLVLPAELPSVNYAAEVRRFLLESFARVDLVLFTERVRLSPPGSRHLRGLTFTTAALNELGRAGAATWLFRPSGEPSPAGWAYIAAGETANVHTAYKCRVRKPWWRVPLVPPADLLLTYMNADTPRLSTNAARAGHLNSVHGVYLAPARGGPNMRRRRISSGWRSPRGRHGQRSGQGQSPSNRGRPVDQSTSLSGNKPRRNFGHYTQRFNRVSHISIRRAWDLGR